MHRKLQNIASISSGYTFRGPVENELSGDIKVVQAKDLVTNRDLNAVENLSCVHSSNIRSPYFLQHNDVLIVSRGSGAGTYRSSLFISSNKNVIASSSVIIIRLADVTVLPKYVSLYLNSDEGQKSLLKIVTGGSYIQSILVKNLSELIVPIPSLHIQKAVIGLEENISEQGKLLKRRQVIQQSFIDASFMNLVKN